MNKLLRAILVVCFGLVFVLTVVLAREVIDIYQELQLLVAPTSEDLPQFVSQQEPATQVATQPATDVPNTAVPTPTDPPTEAPTVAPTDIPLPTQRPLTIHAVAKAGGIRVSINTAESTHNISPLIYGVSGADLDYMQLLNSPLNSWGGNPSTRYNWRHGFAWNAGRDYEYRNGDYGNPPEPVADRFFEEAQSMGIDTRLAVPTLGWVAKDNNPESCSFPDRQGNCTMGEWSDCDHRWRIANPENTSVRSTPADIVDWITHLKASNYPLRFIAMDNEPELWGSTHYDVHPDCTTFQEILDKYIEYSSAIRDIVPEAELTGPTTCCWSFYWESPAGKLDRLRHDNMDFMSFFLDQMRQYDESTGKRHLDVLDIHFYPSEVFYTQDTSPEMFARRARSTASLWDPTYYDEGYEDTQMYVIPRMKQLIEQYYPGTKFGMSEWNFGGEDTMSGALAVADVLGIFGKEDVYFANYWTYPPLDTPAYYAFKMYTNYDDAGGMFGDISIPIVEEEPELHTFAALDSETGKLHVMLINKMAEDSADTNIDLSTYSATSVEQYRYDSSNLNAIVKSAGAISGDTFGLSLPPYSITHLIFDQ